MTPVPSNFYAQWRRHAGAASLLREDHEAPPERLLQAVWQHQRLQRESLKTLDGEPVRVLHPGFLSVEGGPDFRGAVLQLGSQPSRSGDVEVDIRSNGWLAHGHDRNPAFKNVILHAVWDSDRPAAGAPATLPLRRALDAPLGELSLWLGSESAQKLPETMLGQCSGPLRALPATQLTDLLRQAALVRLQGKAAQLQARARQAGWEQALWEGLFRALGYKHNVWPMQRLAELRPRWAAPQSPALAVQARLFGIGGLLPVELTRSQEASDGYLRKVWDQWWRERDEFSDCLLPHALWRFHGLRPANHPQRRLALAAHWSLAANLPSRLEQWCAREMADAALPVTLLEILQVGRDDFWSWHCTFRSARLKQALPLLGATRVTDLAVNVILPWLWIRAIEGKNEALQRNLEHRYFAWPPAEDNSVLRLARQRLLGGAPRRTLSSAAAQQGLLQIVRDFCDHSNAICENCQLPQLVKEFTARGTGFTRKATNLNA